MELHKIKKLKIALDGILFKMEQEAKEQGTGVNSPGFQKRLDDIKKSMLQRFGVDESVYELIDDLIKKQKQRVNDNFEKRREQDLKGKIVKQNIELSGVKSKLDQVDKKEIKWLDITGKPTLFEQSHIRDLSFSLLKHTGVDHPDIAAEIKKLSEKDAELLNTVNIVENKTNERLDTKMKQIKHANLEGIGSNDHHDKYHTLESHNISDWQEKLKRLIGGNLADDLHKHTFPKTYPASMGEPWGITQGDSDSRYVQYTGGIVMPTITGNAGLVLGVNGAGTALEFVASVSTDEKVKYDAGDPTAGYLSAKVVAGTGITLSEGTGADENKLKITNSLDLSAYVPYTGATSNVDLGDNRIILSSVTQPKITVSDTAPASPSVNDLWVDIS